MKNTSILDQTLKPNRMKRGFFWFLGNAAQGVLLYLWLFQSVQWAGNIVKFLAGLTLITSLLAFTDAAKEICQKRGRSMPAWMSQPINAVFVVVLASQGHFLIAGIFTFAMVAESVAFDSKDNEVKDEK